MPTAIVPFLRIGIMSLALLSLAACGGGSDSGGFISPNPGDSPGFISPNPGDSPLNPPTDGGPAPIPYELDVKPITELDGSTENNRLSEQEPLLVTVALTASGAPLPNRPIFLETETDSNLATISPENGSALTDETGQAEFVLRYAGLTGAGTLTARYDGAAGTVTDEAAFEAFIAPLNIGSLDDNGDFVVDAVRVEPSLTLGYQGSAQLLVAVGNSAGERVTANLPVRIESPCLLNGFSSLDVADGVVTLQNGVGSVTYTAGESCASTSDEITATLIQDGIDNPATAVASLTISEAPATQERFITFISATPATIALAGTSGDSSLAERADVVFEVRDGSGNAVSGEAVSFALSQSPGGLQLANSTGVTDSEGLATAVVISGSVATPVRVVATTERSPADNVDNPTSTISNALTVSSGVVTQARFALTADVLNPAAAAIINGTSTNLIVSAFDRFGNAVPDGTAVSFTSECGGVVNADSDLPQGSCELVQGSCTVEWRAQPGADTVCTDDRVTIMAHALGEEAFFDANGDGYYSVGEAFTDNSEAFRDDNESSTYDNDDNDNEIFIDLDQDDTFGEATPRLRAPGGLFNGLACNADGTVCSSDLISVFANLELIAGPQDANALTVTVRDSVFNLEVRPGVDNINPGSYTISLSDTNGNPPPFGTEVKAEGSGACEVVSPETTAPNTNADTILRVGLSVRRNGENDPDVEDQVTVNVTIPSGVGGNGRTATEVYTCDPDA